MNNEKGIASEYGWDGYALDGSGRAMKDDPRVVMFDNFSDYEDESGYPNLRTHLKGGTDPAPKRWIASGTDKLSFDRDEKYSGNYSCKMKVPKMTGSFGSGFTQWVDNRAYRGEPANDNPFTGQRNVENLPEGGFPVPTGVRPREGGFNELYARVMVKYAPGFDRYGHNGIYFNGGWNNRPNSDSSIPNHPGGTAGYRATGYDFFITGTEPETRQGVESPRPGYINVYYYGPEQIGVFGNHTFGDGRVQPSTGGDNLHIMDRVDGVNGFKALPLKAVPVGEWFCLEYYVKLNTVIKNGTDPGPNFYHPIGTPHTEVEKHEQGSKKGIGPTPKPGDCEIMKDGIARVWINGEVVYNYEDFVFRYTDTLTIDLVRFSSYFGRNDSPDSAIWWDNIVVATERIGAVNREGIDPFVTELPPPLPEPEAVSPPPPLAVSADNNTVKKGGNVKLTAVVNPGGVEGTNLDFHNSAPFKLRKINADMLTMPFNGQWGNMFYLEYGYKPGKAITVYYDSPYDLERTKAFLKISGASDMEVNPFCGSDNGPKWQIPIWDWDENNRYFQMHYKDFVGYLGTEDFRASRISLYRLVVALYSERGEAMGAEPVTITGVRLGDPLAVEWSISGSTSANTIIGADGVMTVGSDETAKSLTVNAIMNSVVTAAAEIKILG